MFNNSKIKITSYGFTCDKIHDPFFIAHLSDLHEKRFGDGNEHLFNKIKEVHPDAIALTGDMVAHEKQKDIDAEYTREVARGIADIAPSFFVTGNHERHFEGRIERIMEENGVTVLHGGDLVKLKKGDSTLNISGMDDITFDNADLLSALKIFEGLGDGFNLFLAHRPEYYREYLNKNIDLILCGHTHAGQIRFPVVGTFAMNGQGFMPKYVEGEFTDGITTMIISRGLGASGYPTIRINNPPELVAVTIEPPENTINEF